MWVLKGTEFKRLVSIFNVGAGDASRQWAFFLAAAVIALSAMNLSIGWLGGADVFVRGVSDFPAMVPGTALSVLLSGVAQVLLISDGAVLRRWGAAFVALTCVTAVVAYILSGGGADPADDRMSVATLLAIVLIATSQVSARPDARIAWHAYLGSLVVLIAVVALIGYLIDVQALLSLVLFQGLSVPTSISVLLLSIAAIVSRPGQTWLSIVVDSGVGGRVARRYLPWAFVVPIVLGQLALVLTELGVMDSQLRLLAFTTVLVVLSGGAVIGIANVQAASERRDLGSRENLQAILSGLNAAIFVLGPEGEILGRNRAAEELFGDIDRTADLSALPFHSMPDRDALDGVGHPVNQILTSPQEVLAGLLDATGHERVLRLASFQTGGGQAGDEGFRVIVVSDVTEPWMLQQTVAQSERADALAQLVSGVSHEMQNIFGVINLASGSVDQAVPAASRVIKKASGRGSELAERLQRLTVVHNGAVTVVDVGDSVRSAIDLGRKALPESIDLATQVGDTVAAVACEGSELELALLNLILNARNAINDAGMSGGKITVSVIPGTGEVAIRVADNGPGIPPELIERVREPFFTTRRQQGGTGLGLAAVSDFAAKSGGRFDLQPGPEGGTWASVILPLTNADPVEAAAQEKLRSLHGLSILVADGDRDFVTILSDTLMMLGAKVSRAETAAEALAALDRDTSITLLMTDHVLTGPVGGVDLAVDARARRPDLAVIYMSGALRGSVPKPVIVPGMTLGKPVNMAHLSNAVLRACGRTRRGGSAT